MRFTFGGSAIIKAFAISTANIPLSKTLTIIVSSKGSCLYKLRVTLNHATKNLYSSFHRRDKQKECTIASDAKNAVTPI